MSFDRRVLLTSGLAAVITAGLGLPAVANEVTLGRTRDIQTGRARSYTAGASRLLAFRVSNTGFSVFDAVCPHDGTLLTPAMVRSGRITCSKDKSVFSAKTGAKVAGPSSKGLTKLKHRVSNGFLVVSLPAVVATPTPSQSEKSLIAASKVPVGGGIRVESANGPLVVVQPKAGQFLAYSAICTHSGCEVSQFGKDVMVCTCHNSEFSTTNGAVLSGPARRALAQFQLTEVSGELFLKQ